MFKPLRPVAVLLLAMANPLMATEPNGPHTGTDTELESILEGFESDKPAEPALDDILQGFEDEKTDAGDGGQSLEDILQGFDAPQNELDNAATATPAIKPWEWVTLLSLSSSYNYQHRKPGPGFADYRGLSRLRLKLQPELRYKFTRDWDALLSARAFYDFAYRINGRKQYTRQVLDTYESELEIREAYVRGTLHSDFDITLGRQIVVWGKADFVRVVDVLNPLDFREPGMVDIEDLRLPVFMLRGDYYFGDWDLSAIVSPEIRVGKNPAYGSDFYFGTPNLPAPTEAVPADVTHQEFGLALSGRFQGWDLSLHYASVYDDQAYASIRQNQVILHYPRIRLFGVAGNIAWGNWIVKAEAAALDGLRFTAIDDTFSRFDAMLGVDFSGITDTTLTVEAVNRHLLDYQPAIGAIPNATREDEAQLAFSGTTTFLREKLELRALVSLLGFSTSDGAFYRGTVSYELMDAMTLQVGAIVYHAGDSRISQVAARNDRVFVDWRYSF